MTLVLFSGHRVDAPDRPAPRFPAAIAPAAGRAIAAALPAPPATGIASGANGGDILFLEACAQAGIPCHIVLPFPPDQFIRHSVATPAPGAWEGRFKHLWHATPAANRHVLSLAQGTEPFAACNAAMLMLARELGDRLMLIALWDGQDGDGPGGTGSMVTQARAIGADVVIIDPAELAE